MTEAGLSPTTRVTLPLAAALVCLASWEAAVRWTHAAGLVPSPSGVVQAGARLIADGSVPQALAGSLQRVVIGFFLSALIGVPLGLLVGASRSLAHIVQPVLDALRAIAPIAWIPMAILWLGVRGDAALFIVTYAAVFPFIVNASDAARRVPVLLLFAARSLGASRVLTLRSVILPSALPFIFTGARIAMAFAWGSIIAAELAIGIKVSSGGRAVTGIGQLMVETLYVRRDVDALVFFMLVIGLVSFAIDAGLRRAQTALLPWAYR